MNAIYKKIRLITMKAKHIPATFVLLMGMAGCELMGDLNKMEPPFKMTDKNVITDAKSAESALNGIYESYRGHGLKLMVQYFNVLVGNQKNIYIQDDMDQFKENVIKIDNWAVGEYYPALYLIVNNATSFLYNMEQNKQVKGLSAERRSEIYGEARCLRAQAYLMLLRHFGDFFDTSSKYGIVLYGDTPIRDNISIARSSVEESYKAILADLDHAIENAPAEQPKHYRVGALTAKALKARVLLYMKEFRKAADMAKEVLDEAPGKGYALEDDFKNIFLNSYESSEILFALYASAPDEIYTAPGAWTHFSPGSTIPQIANSLIEGKTDSRYKQIFIDKVNEGTTINKYPELMDDIKQSSHYYIRLAEMYYIIAEAETRLGRIAEARQALKDIICLPRAGYRENYVDKIPESGLLKAILEHKWMEFASENNEEWSDLVRYRVWDKFEIKPYYVRSDAILILPIPKKALVANNLLIQNEGY